MSNKTKFSYASEDEDYDYSSMEDVEEEEDVKSWQIICKDTKVLPSEVNLRISVSTRTDAPSCVIKDKMYSSLKYNMKFCVGGYDLPRMLLMKVRVIADDNKEEVLKEKKPIIRGDTEVSLTHVDGKLQTKSKLQFTDVSYHHSMKYFRLRLDFFLATNPTAPVLQVQSRAFQVFARRSNNTVTGKKRSLPITEEKQAKKRKTTSSVQDFKKAFQELMALKNELSSEEQSLAITEAMTTLLPQHQPLQLPYGFAFPMFWQSNLVPYSDLAMQQQQLPVATTPTSVPNDLNDLFLPLVSEDNFASILSTTSEPTFEKNHCLPAAANSLEFDLEQLFNDNQSKVALF